MIVSVAIVLSVALVASWLTRNGGLRWGLLYLLLVAVDQVLLHVLGRYFADGVMLGFTVGCLVFASRRDHDRNPPQGNDRAEGGARGGDPQGD